MGIHKHAFDWKAFKGSPTALNWARRDLTSVDQVLTVVPGRTTCVQAGGNLGVWPKYLSKHFASVITFEPAPDLFPKLMANCFEPNVIKLQAALGDAGGVVGTECTRRDTKRMAVHEGLTHIVPVGIVPRLRLDALELPVLDLLYLDLEGYELYALNGAGETLRRCRPVIAVEINRNIGFEGFTENDVRSFVVAQGYRPALKVRSDEVFVPSEWK